MAILATIVYDFIVRTTRPAQRLTVRTSRASFRPVTIPRRYYYFVRIATVFRPTIISFVRLKNDDTVFSFGSVCEGGTTVVLARPRAATE